MKICFIKQPGGVLVPESDEEADRLTRLKTGQPVVVELFLNRNPDFHRKVFKFFRFCFNFHSGDNEFQDEEAQFKGFRKDLTILAGYHHSYIRLNGEIRFEARSLAYEKMSQEEFEQCYVALTSAAMKHIFKTADENTYNQLISFF